jgi:hypothetical protein
MLLGDFSAPGFDWECSLPMPNCHHYSKLKADAIYASMCILCLRQCIDAADSYDFLALVFTNLNDVLQSVPMDSGLVKICGWQLHFAC